MEKTFTSEVGRCEGFGEWAWIGFDTWARRAVARLGLKRTMRDPRRTRKKAPADLSHTSPLASANWDKYTGVAAAYVPGGLCRPPIKMELLGYRRR
jgi:hypothetical protein